MMLAQQLYEGIPIGDEGSVGLIPICERTQSTFHKNFCKTRPKRWKNFWRVISHFRTILQKTSKLAQEAHEAIRPTEALRDPASVQPFLDSRQHKLYELIWNRALATQMPQAELDATTIDLQAGNRDVFRATGSVIGLMDI